MKPLIAGAKQEGPWENNCKQTDFDRPRNGNKWWENNEPLHIKLLHDNQHSDDHVHDPETYAQYEDTNIEQNLQNGIYILLLPLAYMCICAFANPTHVHAPQMQDQSIKKDAPMELNMITVTSMMLNMVKWILLKMTQKAVL